MTPAGHIPRNRLESFSDGFFAIIITIMVLELKVPPGADLPALRPLLPLFLSYVLSFVYLAIYWNNHHHLLHAAGGIDGRMMWANAHLLFWLSLIPFTTAWLGENHGASWPTAVYGIVLFMAATAYFILQSCIVRAHGRDSALARALGRDWKGRISVISYAAAVGLAFVSPGVSDAIYVMVALLWLVPDRRMEKVFS
jgi:uncharacterized membrane protein